MGIFGRASLRQRRNLQNGLQSFIVIFIRVWLYHALILWVGLGELGSDEKKTNSGLNQARFLPFSVLNVL